MFFSLFVCNKNYKIIGNNEFFEELKILNFGITNYLLFVIEMNA